MKQAMVPSGTFNMPLAPHFSSAHEVIIKAAKRTICAILCFVDITDEELFWTVVRAEGLITSCPLTHQSENLQDPGTCTHSHFLHGQLGGQFGPDAVKSTGRDNQQYILLPERVSHYFLTFIPTLKSHML